MIICPKCGKAKGVETRRKTTSCPCGRQIKLKRGMFKFMTGSPIELAQTVAKVNAALHGTEPMPREKKRRRKDSYAALVERTESVKDPLKRFHAIAAGLTSSKSEFELDDLKRVLNIMGRDDSERILAQLLSNGVIFEVSPGRYRSV